jgi:hypothetical protein
MKYKRNFNFLFAIFLIITGIYAVIMMPVIGLPIIGGVILQGILGGFSGKVGPVVGAAWKGIDYMRGYVIPANPNTSGQQTVRTKWSVLSQMASSLLSTLITTYWNPFAVQMSGFNRWMQVNYSTLDGSNDLTITSKMAEGTLEGVTGFTVTYATGTGECIGAWDGTIVGNGLDTDFVVLCVYDKTTNSFFVGTGTDIRSAEILSLAISSGLTATNLIGYLFAFRGTGSEFVTSDSVADVAAAP